jgi:hypothetical protein
MANFVLRNNLYLSVAVASYVALNCSSMPVLRRMVGLFFVGLVMRLKGRFPGGFVELITEHLHFTASSRHFGKSSRPPMCW